MQHLLSDSSFLHLAEVYTTDENLEPGDIVSSLSGINVRKTTPGIMNNVMGIVSTAPGSILGSGPDEESVTKTRLPIALAGRVPLKVNLEGGPIAVGDFITVSSQSGIGMRANPASSTRVVAMALESFNSPTPGKILAFIDRLNTTGNSADQISLINTKLSTSIDVLSNLSNGLSALQAAVASSSQVLVSRIDAVDDKITQHFEFNASSTIVSGGLTVKGGAVFSGGLIINSIGSASTTLDMLSDTTFFGRPYFNSDTGGSALIKAGQKKVAITFDKDYLDMPTVNATIALESNSSNDDVAQMIFDQDIRFIVTNKNIHGFTITLNKAASVDINFSWIALAIKNAKLFTSVGESAPTAPSQPSAPSVPSTPPVTTPTPPSSSTTTPASSTPETNPPASAPVTPEPSNAPAPESVDNTNPPVTP